MELENPPGFLLQTPALATDFAGMITGGDENAVAGDERLPQLLLLLLLLLLPWGA
jgi:hypothetical protein